MTAIEKTPLVAIQGFNRAGIVQVWNEASETLYGIQRKSALGKHLRDLLWLEGMEADFDRELAQIWDSGQPSAPHDWKITTAGGKRVWVYSTMVPVVQDNQTQLVFCMDVDVTARKENERALALAAQVFKCSCEAIVIADAAQRILCVNRAFTDITGYRAQEAVGHPLYLWWAGIEAPELQGQRTEQLVKTGCWQGEACGRRSNGETFPAWTSITAAYDEAGKLANYIAIFSDITERKKTDEKIRHLVEHDFLTGLPNRALLQDRLQQAMATARRHRGKLGLLFIDLDHFKNVNDTLGHPIGDKLLQSVAERLKKCVRGNDTVSRQGGDEFIIMLPEVHNVAQLAHIATNIVKTIGQPCQINDHSLSISTSIGIAVFPEDGNDITTLIKHADIAMYHAKEAGRNGYQFFNQDMNARIVQRVTLECQLRRALQEGQLVLQYQPELGIASGRTVGVEALIRWQHPESGFLMPERFLPVAEECGLIVPIGDWVLQSACRQGMLWHEQGIDVSMSVNLSATQFRQKNFLDRVAEILRDTRLPPRMLQMEVAEGVLFDNIPTAIDTMRALRGMGIKLAVDDFGTGYSSLGYLKHFPVDKLKIDRSFVRDLAIDANDAAIIRAILIMAKSLKLCVIAEGVETYDQLQFLQAQGCDEYQGNYASRPLPAAKLGRFLHA